LRLLLPLKHYDEAGKVKPPVALYWCALFLCRSLVVLVGALSSRQYGNELLALFYSESRYLYMNLIVAMPTLISLIIIGFRETSWVENRSWLFVCIRPLMIFSALVDFSFHIFFANLHHWQFSWVISFTFLLDSLCLYFLIKDKHILMMIKDWRSPVVTKKPIQD
jgi:hypothetical protein